MTSCRSFLLAKPNFPALDRDIAFVKERFLNLGFFKLKTMKVILDDKADDGGKHFAYCHRGTIGLSPIMASLPRKNRVAILAHEFGHAADWAYPAIYSELTLKQWRARSFHEIEVTADKLGELALGRRIGYRTPCNLQTLDASRGRPKGLR